MKQIASKELSNEFSAPVIKKLALFLIVIAFNSCKGYSQKLRFYPIKMINKIDSTITINPKSGKQYYSSKQEFYLVENYHDNVISRKQFDDFVAKSKSADFGNFSSYYIVFYKKSNKTTIKNINQDRRIIDRYSNQHDLLYEYAWYEGKFLSRFQYEEGGAFVDSTNDIIVTDVPK